MKKKHTTTRVWCKAKYYIWEGGKKSTNRTARESETWQRGAGVGRIILTRSNQSEKGKLFFIVFRLLARFSQHTTVREEEIFPSSAFLLPRDTRDRECKFSYFVRRTWTSLFCVSTQPCYDLVCAFGERLSVWQKVSFVSFPPDFTTLRRVKSFLNKKKSNRKIVQVNCAKSFYEDEDISRVFFNFTTSLYNLWSVTRDVHDSLINLVRLARVELREVHEVLFNCWSFIIFWVFLLRCFILCLLPDSGWWFYFIFLISFAELASSSERKWIFPAVLLISLLRECVYTKNITLHNLDENKFHLTFNEVGKRERERASLVCLGSKEFFSFFFFLALERFLEVFWWDSLCLIKNSWNSISLLLKI